MPSRRSKSSSGIPRAAIVLAATALGLFIAGQGFRLSRTDSGRLLAARYLRIGDAAEVTRIVGTHIRRGLEAVGVSRDSVEETVTTTGPARVRWRVGLKPDDSLIQANYAITKCLKDHGAVVLSGREHPGKDGEMRVTILAGLPGRTTHEVVLARSPPSEEPAAAPGARLALVLYGFGDDVERAGDFFRMPQPFAVALAPGAERSATLFRAAREHDREVVLHLPLEPINYPQVNPGPGTILVTMRPAKITGLLRRYLDQAGAVAAVANQMGSLATQDMTVMETIYGELKRRHLPFLHVTPAAGAVCKPLAADLGVSYDEPDAVLDAEARKSGTRSLDASWSRVLSQTRERGQMVVMVRATPLVLRWLPGATASRRLGGVSLVPVSSLLKKPAVL